MLFFKTAKEESMDIITAMEKIMKKTRKCKLKDRFFKKVEKYTSFLSEKLDLGKVETVFLTVMMNWESSWRNNEFSGYFGLENISLVRFKENIKNLIDKKFISRSVDDDGEEFEVRQIVRETLSRNEPYKFDPKKEPIVVDKNSTQITRIKSGEITEREMFYNEHEQDQINDVIKALNPEMYTKIHEKLVERHARTNFSCLFYGGPGTGKTETALQIAKLTGRDIFIMTLSEARSKWYGETEKIIKSMFDKYKKAVNNSSKTPILFINEADALLSQRSEAPGTPYGENTMKNIILQELEDLDGIFIATTNLANSLDKAMERRFFYKIEFKKPEPKVRAKIWKSMIPKISDDFAQKLGNEYDFAGGIIDNVNRKCIIHEVIHDEEVNEPKIIEFCQQETISEKRTKGFSAI